MSDLQDQSVPQAQQARRERQDQLVILARLEQLVLKDLKVFKA